jgi:hypothetical protein
MLPTPGALAASRRNALWLDAHPEHRQVPAEGPPPDLSAFRDPEWPGRWAEIGLALLAVASLLEVVFDAWHLSVLSRDLSVPANAQAYLDSTDRLDAMAIAVGLGSLLCAVTFIVWTRRAYRNLPALGAGQRFKPGWAVGGWFVPFMNLWRPKQMVNDIWRTGDPRAPRVLQPSRYEHVRVPRTITAWWLLFILGNLAGRLLWSTSLDTVAHERLFTERDLTSSAIDIVTLLLALWVVRSLTRRQQARARALAAPGLGGLGLERPQP